MPDRLADTSRKLCKRNYWSERRSRCRRLSFDHLEQRALLASVYGQTLTQAHAYLDSKLDAVDFVTVIDHGYQLTGDDSYMDSMAEAIVEKTGGYIVDYQAKGVGATPVFDILEFADTNPLAGQTVVFLFDWALESRIETNGWGEAAGDAQFAMLVGLELIQPFGNVDWNYHFIGHSMGTVVVSETVERMALYDIPVDHVTFLDPHDFDEPWLPDDGDAGHWKVGWPSNDDPHRGYGVTVWDNVEFADTYYQTASRHYGLRPNVIIPSGRPIPGSYNVFLDTAELNIDRDTNTSNHDHGYVWTGYYLDSILNPYDSSNEHGYRYSLLASPTQPPNRPVPGDQEGLFYGPTQDHRWSSVQLVTGDFGDDDPGVRTLPSIGGLSQLNKTISAINESRQAPLMSSLKLTGGEFDVAAETELSDVLVGNSWVTSVAPGWSMHGGGIARVENGVAHLMNVADPSAWFNLGGWLPSIYIDDAVSVIQHNVSWIPESASQIEVNLRKILNHQTQLGTTFDAGAHSLEVFLGSQRIGKLSVNDIATSFSSHWMEIPVPLRGTVQNLLLFLQGPGQQQSLLGFSPDELQIDYVRFTATQSLPPQPDLIVAAIVATAGEATIGSVLPMQLTVTNAGAADAVATQVRYTLSTDQIADAGDYVISGSQAFGAIAASSSTGLTANASIPLNVPPGNYFVIASIDPIAGELRTNNNSRATATKLAIGVPPLPDFFLRGLQAPSYGLPAQSITVNVTLENIGGPLAVSFPVQFSLERNGVVIPLEGQPLTRQQVGSFSQVLTLPADLTEGSYLLRAVVNHLRQIPESNDQNNTATASLTVDLPEPPASPNIGFQYPIGSPQTGSFITQPFNGNFENNIGHLGVDFRGAQGEPVYAIADGTVVYNKDLDDAWGRVIIIKHNTRAWGWDKDIYSMYAHVQLRPNFVLPRDVTRGLWIAEVGPKASTSSAPHLHFSIRSSQDMVSTAPGVILGPAYHNGARQQIGTNSYTVGGFAHDIVWHDPIQVIDPNRVIPPTPLPELQPRLVNAPPSGIPGQAAQVFFEIENRGTTTATNIPVQIVISTDRYITARDTAFGSTTIPQLAPGEIFRRALPFQLPPDLIIGKEYFVGLRVDPANVIIELDDANNDLSDSNGISMVAAVVSLPDLVGQSLAINTRSPYRWGQQLAVEFQVKNVGTLSAASSLAKFYLANDPKDPTFEVELGQRSVVALAAGATAIGQINLSLPNTPPPQLAAGGLYLLMRNDVNLVIAESNNENNYGQGLGVDSVRVPLATPVGPADVRGVNMHFDPPVSTLNWGRSYRLDYTFTNQGGSTTTPFPIKFYLNSGSTNSANGLRVGQDNLGNIAPGQSLTRSVWITLPPQPPAGTSSGTYTIGMFLDPDRTLNETDRGDNQGLGSSIDLLSVKIVPGSLVPQPVIGSFTVSPGTVVRGEKVKLIANDVVDDNNVVNELVFKLDTNGNNLWDDSDLYLDHGSKSGVTFTAETRTNINWPSGPVTVMARAMDNHGLLSAVSFATVTIQGLPLGPFPDDAYENNDTRETAYHLGGAGDFIQEKSYDLALAEGDDDYFTFDVVGANALITARIEFQQDVAQPNNPSGDLYLELTNAAGTHSIGFSDLSDPGTTFEQVQATQGQGRYVLRIAGQVIMGGGLDRNPNYTLKLTVQNEPTYPIAAPLIVDTPVITQGELLTLRTTAPTLFGGYSVDAAHFYLDRAGDGQIQFDPDWLASDWGATGEEPPFWTISHSTADIPPGDYAVYLLVTDTLGRTSLATTNTVRIEPNLLPAVGSLLGPVAVIQGANATFVAQDVVDLDPSGDVTQVEFFLDTDGSGLLDAEDNPVGMGIRSGANWALTSNTLDWPLGTTSVIVVPTDSLGAKGEPVARTLEVVASTNQQPTIGTFSLPISIEKGNSIALTISGATDPNGDPLIAEFYFDANSNRAWDAGDTQLATGNVVAGQFSYTATSDNLLHGPQTFFAVVRDDGVPAYVTSLAGEILVIDRLGGRVVSQTPAVSAAGSLDALSVTFNEPIEPSSFTLADITSFTGPGGTIVPLSVNPVTGSGNQTFEIRFPRQTAVGSYSLNIGPQILDLGGNELDQDADGTSGEATADRYTATFAIAATDVVYQWAAGLGISSLDDRVNAVAVTTAGDLIAVGRFTGTIDFDPGAGETLATSQGGFDVFIAKLSAAGNLLWVRTLGGSSTDFASAVDVDAAGNVYVGGEFRNTVDLNPTAGTANQTSAGAGDIFLLSLTSAGAYRWSQRIGGTYIDAVSSLNVSGSDVYVGGAFTRTVDFNAGAGTNNFTAPGTFDGTDGFVLKVSAASGAYQWAKQLGGTSDDRVEGLAIDSSGNVLATGWFNSTANFDPGATGLTRTTAGSQDMFVSKYSSTGSLTWNRTFGSTSSDEGFGVAVDSSSSVYITGSFVFTVDFDPSAGVQNLVSAGGLDAVVLKLNSSGNYVWARRTGGSAHDRGLGIHVSAASEVYVVGEFDGTSLFNATSPSVSLSSAGDNDGFVLKVSTANQFRWAKGIGSAGKDSARSIVTDANRGIAIAGWFTGVADFDPNAGQVTLTSTGEDGFLAHWDEPLPNDPPVIAAIADRVINEGQTLAFTVSATDPQQPLQTLAYRFVGTIPAGLSIHAATGQVSWTPSESQGPGVYDVVVEVADSGNPSLAETRAFRITVQEVNVAPILTAYSAQNVFEGITLVVPALASDADLPNNSLAYSLEPGAPMGVTINTTTGEVRWTPTESQGPGTYNIGVRVTDSGVPVLSSVQTLPVTVHETNTSPLLAQVTNLTVTSGQFVDFFVSAFDSDLPAQSLSYGLISNAGTSANLSGSNGRFTWNTAGASAGVYAFTVNVTDNGSPPAAAAREFTIAVLEPTFRIANATHTTTGFVLDFSGDIDAATLNIGDADNGSLGPSDVMLVGATVGNVRGSVVLTENSRRLTFIATSGRLAPDDYTITLVSGVQGFREQNGELLDGDSNGTAGGSFVHSFAVIAPPANAISIGVPNIARGPQQPVNIPVNTSSGIPISFSDGNGITSAIFELRYDPQMLNIASASVEPGLPVGAVVNLNTSSPGIAVIEFTSPTPLTVGTTRFVDLQATVPSTATYRGKQILDITNISLNGGTIPGLDDDGVHAVAFFADVTGNGTYSAQDASYIARLAVGIDTGLKEFALLDPTILGDITGNGTFSATDTSLMLQAAVGILVPEIPTPLPTVSLTQGGPDPKLSIPQNLVATAGGSLIIPVDIDSIVNLTGNGLESADLVIYYDPTVFEITAATLGRLVAQRGWMISSRIDPLAGRIDLSLAGTRPLEGQFIGELVQLHATVKTTAPVRASAINLAATSRSRSTQLNEGFLTLVPAPTDASNDAIDGRVAIQANDDTPAIENTARLIGEQLLITGSRGDDRILVGLTMDGRLRVRIGNQFVGDFAVPTGIAVDALTGNDFVYVAPFAPPAVISANLSVHDQIFGEQNSKVIHNASELADPDLSAQQSAAIHTEALLQLLTAWQADFDSDEISLRPRSVRRLT